MDSATEDLYFQKIEELIQDEDKIVTVPYLSKSLKIAVQDSEKLLSKYLKDQRTLKPNELAATYIFTGIVKDKGSGVFFIKEDDLQDKRLLFDKIDSEVLFSVQKCKQIDLDVIALVDDVTKPCTEPLLGSIVSKNCVKRVLKVKKLPTPPPSTVKGKSSFFMSKTDSSSSVEKSEKPESKVKQNGIAGLFGKAAATQLPKDKDTVQKKTTNASKQPSHKGGLSTFLSKGSSSSSIKSENGIKKEKTISTTISSEPSEIEELMEIDFYEELDEVTVDDKKIKKEEENKSEQKDTNKKEVKEKKKQEVKEKKKQEVKEKKKQEGKEKQNKNKRQREKSEEKSIKKRKRIVQRNDSESDDMFENDEEDIVEKSDDEPERIPSPVASKPLAPKNKIRKAIDNTYMDEDGFIVTKTEYVYESAPEDVEEPKKEKEVKAPKLEKKTSASSENDGSPKKGKNKKGKKNNLQNQPTLMNFFKKK